jgi:hypothetical protein
MKGGFELIEEVEPIEKEVEKEPALEVEEDGEN